MEPILSRLADTVAEAGDIETLTRPILELIELVTGMESSYLTRVDEAAGVQHILFARNSAALEIPEALAVPWGDTLCRRALEEGRACTDDVAGLWGDSGAARELGIRSYLSQPVRRFDGSLYGTLCSASARRVPVAETTVRVLALFARIIGQQLDRERILHETLSENSGLRRQSTTDALTGLANRRGLALGLQRMLQDAQRRGESLQVAFIDLDGFKAINDDFGHEVGDRFLVFLAERLQGSVRSGDLVARYGGDEFVVVAAGISESVLDARLRVALAGAFRYGDVMLTGSGSIGVTTAGTEDIDADRLLARADARMYAVKRRSPAAAGQPLNRTRPQSAG